ncbi:MAG: hypothetical protein QM704_03655 [Anaeromyxobacteraceae bacterium]
MSAGALSLVLALAAAGGPERLLLCRPKVLGVDAQARPEAVAAAGRATGRFLDYGVTCEDAGEGARAARRAGFGHAVTATAEGLPDASRYVLVLSDAATESQRARRTLDVPAGKDAVAPVQAALLELVKAVPQPPRVGPSPRSVVAWSLVGAGLAAVAAGGLLAKQAGDAADAANGAATPDVFTHERAAWKAKNRDATAALAAGGAAVVAGLTLRFAF